MLRLLVLTLVGLGLIWSGPAMADNTMARAGTANAVHSIDVDLTYPTVYAYVSQQPVEGSETARLYPPSTTLTVTVKDAAGNPVSGVPVTFDVASNSMLKGLLSIKPERQETGHNGEVQATLEPTARATTGTGDILVHVNGQIQAVPITVNQSPVRGQ